MAITVEAVYENGVLKLDQPLPLPEHQKVRVTIEPALTWAERTAGIMAWQGSSTDAEYFATSPELDFPSPEEEP
jgi:predicted DNA-binding antitoxin AbrB/MazE fold protein